jgi:hypothetical protein
MIGIRHQGTNLRGLRWPIADGESGEWGWAAVHQAIPAAAYPHLVWRNRVEEEVDVHPRDLRREILGRELNDIAILAIHADAADLDEGLRCGDGERGRFDHLQAADIPRDSRQ